ncbi:MAG: transketolase [Proteobacteria bacterium]|jgi:transketolase|nr:transketolase [Pseudomonadota bacterium]MBT5064698.1 transketolase [Pseudomonadota bacterium]MBT6192863.1 transketolase [Pseudomonadota bacterium]MBT6465085.1 transketolase [Pseudomonadota bacterium]MBT6673903.1 transketolase [Pseudomonadota bacterium]
MENNSGEPTSNELANAIRALSMDAVQAANSGHPGAPMGMADIAEALWRKHLNHNPQNPNWFNRDRFVLSNGHGSMLLYSLLHLTGYDLGIEDIKNFRQLGSKTPGHPEYRHTPGVETTTGPLGQGIANAVGMALTEAHLAARFNKPDLNIIDHYTYVFAGDGCLMEGISHEACSLAGTLKLNKLILFYDDNGISIDGEIDEWFTDNTPERFTAYGWNVIPNVDGHDTKSINAAIDMAKMNHNSPTLICCKTVIGKGSPNKAGTSACHGAALGEEEIVEARKELNWQYEPFDIPESVYNAWSSKNKGQALEEDWNKKLSAYGVKYKNDSELLELQMHNKLPQDWERNKNACIQKMLNNEEGFKEATRKSSERVLDSLAANLPMLLGGSADLTGSNNTWHSSSKAITGKDRSGNYVYYGVREFAMSAMMNGMCLHGGVVPYSGTFLVFSDYARNAVRMAALMEIAPIFVYSHDSVALGEDGPTHQPVEHTNSLRLIPNLDVWRPADTTETAVAWITTIENRKTPSCLLLTRQGLPALHHTSAQSEEISRGGYILLEPPTPASAVIMATGSEVGIALQVANALNEAGSSIRVVSIPCVEIFNRQSADWQNKVLSPSIKKRISIEAGNTDFWYRYTGLDGLTIGINTFGVSSPGNEALEHFGLDTNSCIQQIDNYLKQ